jgi:tetratricopeptide (TPR) repeat protein
MLQSQEGTECQRQSVSATPIHRQQEQNTYYPSGSNQVSELEYQRVCILTPAPSVLPGESPPPRPRACFGRDELIEKIVDLAETLTPVALIGAGGIGKTSVALTILHDCRIKQRFGENRRFIRCDQITTSLTNFLARFSKVVGAGVENPEDLTPLRPFLSSKEMFIILDNAESILDPQGTDAREIYAMVEELSQFETICLCITSRITTVPPHCMRLKIPTLSMEAACDIFYGIYNDGGRSHIVNNLLQRLDFHALSTALLATAASHNMWNHDRLAREWIAHRTKLLRTDHNESLAATIELSLASPMFCKLGPNARDLLGVIAFFPQGIDENNIDWLFPTIPDRKNIFNKLCILSLTYRSDTFIRMLAPLRDYLRPEDPTSSPLLRATKERYLGRLSAEVDPGNPSYKEAQWITSEDINVEHLLDVFTSVDVNSDNTWDACAHFMEHLYWHKSRLVVLGPKLEGLPDNHPSKPKCLFELSRLFVSIGHLAECKRLLTHTLKLWRERERDPEVARTLRLLAYTNGQLRLYKEGIPQAKESLEINERLNHVLGKARSLQELARLLDEDNQPDDAEEAASRSIKLLPSSEQFLICRGHRILGNVYRSKGEAEKAINHYGTALRIASFNWHDQQFWIHYSLAGLFCDQRRFDDAHAHVEHAKTHAVNDAYNLGCAMRLQAEFWYQQGGLEEGRSGALCAVGVFEKLVAERVRSGVLMAERVRVAELVAERAGAVELMTERVRAEELVAERVRAAEQLEKCRTLLRDIERKMEHPAAFGGSDFGSELPETVLLPTPVNSLSSARESR